MRSSLNRPVVLGLLAGSLNASALAQQQPVDIDWNQLNLNSDHSKQIQTYESEWRQDYNRRKSETIEEQRKLQRMLESHDADALEMMNLQQSIARKKERLYVNEHGYDDGFPFRIWLQQVNGEEELRLKLLEAGNPEAIEIKLLRESIRLKRQIVPPIPKPQHELEQMMIEQMIRQRIQEKQRELHPSAQTEVVPDRIQDIMQKVRNIWPSSRPGSAGGSPAFKNR